MKKLYRLTIDTYFNSKIIIYSKFFNKIFVTQRFPNIGKVPCEALTWPCHKATLVSMSQRQATGTVRSLP